MIFLRSYSDPFRRHMAAACFGPAAVAVPYVTMELAAAGTAMSIASQAHQAGVAAANANYQSQVARNNQEMQQRNVQILEQNARDAEARGQIAEDQQRQKTTQLIGAQRAALASQGGDINSGSDVDLIGDTARAREFTALTPPTTTHHHPYS